MFEQIIDKQKTQVPCFRRIQVCEDKDTDAKKISIKLKGEERQFTYYQRPYFLDERLGTRSEYNLFPIVLNPDGSPWILACLFILNRFECGSSLDYVVSNSEDLGAFNHWLNQAEDPDGLLTHFPSIQIARVTYRYQAHLINQIYTREIDSDTAQRRMSLILKFYKWLIDSKFFSPENPICEEGNLTISYRNDRGFQQNKRIITTDLKIDTPLTADPFDGTILDGGKLRPLSDVEQEWVFNSLKELNNTEMYLILLFMVATGARIQSVCTLRMHHFQNSSPKIYKSIVSGQDEVRIKAGPGTGIDTKNNKSGLLMVPKDLYDLLHTYILSFRARHRYTLTPAGISPSQFVFLTRQGTPYFEAREHTNLFNPDLKRRHFKKGGTVRQFVKDSLLPFIHKRYDKNFTFRLHDLRATFGMNTESILVNRMNRKELKMDKVRQILSALMWHKSTSTTDLYLNYRSLNQAAAIAVDKYGLQVQEWIKDARTGFCDDDQ